MKLNKYELWLTKQQPTALWCELSKRYPKLTGRFKRLLYEEEKENEQERIKK